MNSTKMPKTVRELGEMAEAQGITAVELLGKLGPIPTPPVGFTEAMDAMHPELPAGYFDGPSVAGDGWRIESTFTFEHGVTFELLPPNGDYRMVGMTAQQAIAAGTALAALGRKYAA
ncbi:hypothetical protein J2X01_000730 [Arthrobacter ginsengisoli]|uniref:Uncharacterized protein n=1 Tax=Arthrobacter ginsengisoli TaxID=1356565 RepID=A0ABU1U8D8_9MICC|nr:hypothetical protein [Arthrobacter ginsengisoli]MDR7081453.1 hypothetical protein [Arthrobacter ginsengisoli]